MQPPREPRSNPALELVRALYADSPVRRATAVFALPALLALAVYLPGRVRFAREMRAARRHLGAAGDLDLFALRALARQPLPVLARLAPDPAGAWRRGDPEVVRALARLELDEIGLRPRP